MSRIELKRKIGHFWPSNKEGRKLILLYHSVGNTPWGMSEKFFNEQINWITDHCKICSLTDLIQSKPSQETQIALSFDDGYQSLYEIIAPIFFKKNIGATVYINTGWMGESENKRRASIAELGHYPDEFFLIWNEVKALHNFGWEIGSHGVNHYDFSRLEEEKTYQELRQSKKDIEDYLKVSCKHFAYPWGNYSKNTKKIVKEAGYQYATSVVHGKVTPASDLFAIPRINIAKEYSFEDFKNIIRGKWDFLRIFQKFKRI